MKFEVGKEYVCQRGELRIRVVAVNEWGAAFEHLAGVVAGQFGHCQHCDHGWRPAPRVAERWIVESQGSAPEAFMSKSEAQARRTLNVAAGLLSTVNGPFQCEAP